MQVQNVLGDFCDNGFHSRLHMYPHQSLGIGIVNSITIPVTLSTNVLLIFSLVKTDQLRSISNRFVLLLSLSDCGMAVIVQTLVSLLFTTYRTRSVCEMEAAATFVTFFFGHLSGFSILSVSIDRCIHMTFLYKYNKIMTNARGVMAIVGCIIFACAFGTAYLLGIIYKKYPVINGIILVMDLIVIMTIYVVYTATYLRVKKHVDETAHLRQSGSKSPKIDKDSRKKPEYATAMAKTIFVILGTVFVCYVPYVTVSMVWVVKVTTSNVTTSPYLELTMYSTYLLVYLNSALNSIIFLNGNKKCKAFVLGMIKRHRNYEVSETLSTSTSCTSL